MLSKKITHKTDLVEHIIKGLDAISSIVSRTLGPGGLPILIERVGQDLRGDPLQPMITKDGVTVASECASSEPEVDLIIQSVKAICQKTNRVAGDGTTTAIVLGKFILDCAHDVLNETNMNPQELKKSIESATKTVVEELRKISVPCDSFDSIENVATISANGDKDIGKIIKTAFEAVGAEGVITIDEGSGKEHSLEVVNGLQIKRGAEAQDRFFNNQTGIRYEAENVHVVLYDGKLQDPGKVLKILELIYKTNKGAMPPVLFMANEFSLDVIQLLLINKVENKLSVCAVRGPHTTKIRTVMYDDLAVFLGGTRMGNGNRNLNNIEYDDIGIADKMVADKYLTTFFGGAGAEEEVLARVDQLKAQKKTAESDYDAALLSGRIGSLSEGVAQIGVGGSTEFEIKEKYHRIEDAVNASRAALAEGVVSGGGAALYRIAIGLKGSSPGVQVMKEALKAPLYQILVNLGLDSNQIDELAPKLMKSKDSVYDGISRSVVNGFEQGIIDPVKVVRVALENAVSISALLSTCGGAITYERKK